MRNNIFLGLIFTICLGLVSTTSLAEVSTVSAKPANITAIATSPAQHLEAAKLHREHEEHDKAMAEHFISIALEYEKEGHPEIMRHYERMAEHHDALAKEHEQAAITHEKLALTK